MTKMYGITDINGLYVGHKRNTRTHKIAEALKFDTQQMAQDFIDKAMRANRNYTVKVVYDMESLSLPATGQQLQLFIGQHLLETTFCIEDGKLVRQRKIKGYAISGGHGEYLTETGYMGDASRMAIFATRPLANWVRLGMLGAANCDPTIEKVYHD